MTKLARACLLGLVALGCSAPPAEPTCEDYCRNLIRCGLDTTERFCMWNCLAFVEYREGKGRRCSRAVRRELACLARSDDCEFVLNDTTYNEGDPCFRKGHKRSNACQEDDIPSDELVPIEGLPRSDAAPFLSVDVAPEEEASP